MLAVVVGIPSLKKVTQLLSLHSVSGPRSTQPTDYADRKRAYRHNVSNESGQSRTGSHRRHKYSTLGCKLSMLFDPYERGAIAENRRVSRGRLLQKGYDVDAAHNRRSGHLLQDIADAYVFLRRFLGF